MTKVGFISLGCSKNLVDTEVMLHCLLEAGYEIVSEDIDADVVVVNTCGFIESAKSEAIENILDVAELKKMRHLRGIVACGCLVERYREEIFKELPEVDALLGVGSLRYIADAVAAVMRGEKYARFDDKETSALGGDRLLTTPPYTAYLKIAEGCDNRCTYCAIPLIRGGFRSRTIEDVIKEAKELEALGVKELNLIAQDTTRYGLDIYGEYALHRLVRRITEETEIPWIRLLYCYPDKITDELLSEMRDNPRLLPYMDIPVQHISDDILRKMNRHGDSACIRDAIKRIRDAVPGVTLRTTAIVGFPGESDADFEALCRFIKEIRFDRFGAFPYSAEEGTPAAEMDGQLDEQTKQHRYDILMQTQTEISAALLSEKVGKTLTVLCEGYDVVAECYYGRSAADAPDVDGKIYFMGKKGIPEGEFVKVKIVSAEDYDLIGEVTE